MSGFLRHVLLSSLVLVILAGLVLVAAARDAVRLLETVLEPWFSVCRALTPDTWEAQGNIPLGMIWLISGVVLYALVGGVMIASVLTAWRSRSRDPDEVDRR